MCVYSYVIFKHKFTGNVAKLSCLPVFSFIIIFYQKLIVVAILRAMSVCMLILMQESAKAIVP